MRVFFLAFSCWIRRRRYRENYDRVQSGGKKWGFQLFYRVSAPRSPSHHIECHRSRAFRRGSKNRPSKDSGKSSEGGGGLWCISCLFPFESKTQKRLESEQQDRNLIKMKPILSHLGGENAFFSLPAKKKKKQYQLYPGRSVFIRRSPFLCFHPAILYSLSQT